MGLEAHIPWAAIPTAHSPTPPLHAIPLRSHLGFRATPSPWGSHRRRRLARSLQTPPRPSPPPPHFAPGTPDAAPATSRAPLLPGSRRRQGGVLRRGRPSMGVVHYRYRSGLQTFSVQVPGAFASVAELKRLIAATGRHGAGRTRGRGPRDGIALCDPRTGEGACVRPHPTPASRRFRRPPPGARVIVP